LFHEKGGSVLKVINSLVYKKYEPVFTRFVENFNSLKEQGGYYKTLGKTIINSLYGSMALNSKNEIMYITFSDIEFREILEHMSVSNFYKINESFVICIKKDYKAAKFFKKAKYSNFSDRNVSYSAAIASKARIKLYRAMFDVIKDGGRLLYCDTDSIFAAYNINDKRAETSMFK